MDVFAGPHACRHCTATFSTSDKLQRHRRYGHPRRHATKRAALATFAAAALILTLWLAQPAPVAPLDAFATHDDPLLGSAEAPWQAVIFESPSCQACAAFHAHDLPALLAGPVAEQRLALRFLAAPGSGAMDRTAGIAQECAYRDGGALGFQGFSARLFANQSQLDEHVVHVMLQEYATTRSIPEEQIMRCYYAQESGSAVSQDWRIATKHGASPGTVFLVGGGVERMDIGELRLHFNA